MNLICNVYLSVPCCPSVQSIKGQPGMVSWRHGHYEALDLSRKSLSGDKALIFSMCTLEEFQILSKVSLLNGCIHTYSLPASDDYF